MSLKVTVKNTTKLPDLPDEHGSLDPYVAVKFRGRAYTMHIVLLYDTCDCLCFRAEKVNSNTG